MESNVRRLVGWASVFGFGVLMAIGINLFTLAGDWNVPNANGAITNPLPTDSATPSPEEEAECAPTWKMVEIDNTNYQVIAGGVAAIKNAQTNEEAAAAFQVWQDKVRQDPDLLAGQAKYFLHRDVDRATLVDANGCATKAADQLSIELGFVAADALITPEDAPSDGNNSGVENGVVVADPNPGIDGDRSAIKVVLKDGTVVWIMARCGNFVTQGSVPPVPPGKTDQPPQPPPPTTPPVCTNCNPPDDSKKAEDDVQSPGDAWTQRPVEGAPAAPAPAPAVPFTPSTPPGSDTGGGTPVTGATPAPAPAPQDPPVVTDPEVSAPPEAPSDGEITDPDG